MNKRNLKYKLFTTLKYLIVLNLIALNSCTEEYSEVQRIEFKEGNHKSNHNTIRSQKSNELSFYVSFNETCKYDLGPDQTDKNKLIGLSTCFDPNWDKQSFRFSWYNLGDSIRLGAYIHENDTRKIHLKTIGLNESVFLYMKVLNDSVLFQVDNVIIYESIKHHETNKYYIPAWWFGGNNPAPHYIFYDVILI